MRGISYLRFQHRRLSAALRGIASYVLTQVSSGRKNHVTFGGVGALSTLVWNLDDEPDRLWLGKRDRAEILQRAAADAAPILGPDPAPDDVSEGGQGEMRDPLAAFCAALADVALPVDTESLPTAEAGCRALAFVETALASVSSGSWVSLE
jgi:hypothetical protein